MSKAASVKAAPTSKTGHWKKAAFELAEQLGALEALQHAGAGAGQGVYVLAYRRVDDPQSKPWLDPEQISATPEQFEAQMGLIYRRYTPVSIEDVIEAIDRRKQLPKNAVLVTVDGGYLDFQEYVYPIASFFGVQPVLFSATAFVGQGGFWWDRLYRAVYNARQPEVITPLGRLPLHNDEQKQFVLRQLRRYISQLPPEKALQQVDFLSTELMQGKIGPSPRSTLTWKELRQLSDAGVTVAAHTHTYSQLSRLSLEQARQEVCRSQNLIREKIGRALPVFAFPDAAPAALRPDLRQMLVDEGFKLAFTQADRQAQLHRDDLLAFPRLSTSTRLNLGEFHWRLTPTYRPSNEKNKVKEEAVEQAHSSGHMHLPDKSPAI